MASIDRYPTAKGVGWRARWRTPDGASRSRVFSRKVDAERFLVQLEQAKLRGAYVDPAAGRVLLREYGERWRVNQVQHRTSTRARVEGDLRNHLYPTLGGRPLNSIIRSDVQAWVTQLSGHLAPTTVSVVYSYLATILKSAVADGIIAATPCHNISLPEIPVSRVVPLSAGQVEAIAASMPPRHRGWVLTGAMTGLRFGELAGLTVDRVNFISKALTVDRQWTAGGFGPPKSPTSYRDVPLGEVAVRALADHLAAFPALEPAGMVFHTGSGPLTRPRMHEVWKRALRTVVDSSLWAGNHAPGTRKPLAEWLGRPVSPHDLRHFYASALIRQGADVKLVQARLGHKSAQTTIDIYGHLWPDSDERTRTAIDAVFDRALARAADVEA